MPVHEVRFSSDFTLTFHRTLRVPDDGKQYPLPPGLGPFPIEPTVDHASSLPEAWRGRPGVMIPMYQREALWLGFRTPYSRPHALQVSVGGVNAITGERSDAPLCRNPQNYLVTPPQVWLDGVRTRTGSVRQFVAVELGAGKTLEAAITAEESVGGIQVRVFPPHPSRLQPQENASLRPQRGLQGAMGIGAGGEIAQKIYPDPHGIEAWDVANLQALDVHLLSIAAWKRVTGREPPPTPIEASAYSRHGLPWFALYDADRADLGGSDMLAAAAEVSSNRLREAGTEQESISIEDLTMRWLHS